MTVKLSATPRRKRLSREERGAALIEAAAKIVSDQGVEALTMEGLADQAGVNKALVYRFHANRDAVLLALWDHETAAFDARVVQSLVGRSTLEAQFRTLVDLWLDEVEAGASCLERLGAPGVGPPELEARRHARTADTVNFLADLIQAEYPVARQDAVIAASVLGAGNTGLRALREHTGWSRRKLTSRFVEICMGALEAIAR